MNVDASIPDFNAPVVEHARKDFPLLDGEMTVGEALERIRREGVGERVIYFYAVDEEKRLVGVLPTRRLLTASLETPLHQIMVRRVVAIPATATVLDACEFFVLYKFLAFPVVDEQRHVIGIIDANLFAEEILEAGESESRQVGSLAGTVGPEFFEALGFRLEQIRGASPWRSFRFRFPWLLVTVTGGTLSAILAGFATSYASVIVAALNAGERLAGVVRAVAAANIRSGIIVVDTGSTDQTAYRARAAGANVVAERKHGYGRACIAGTRALSP